MGKRFTSTGIWDKKWFQDCDEKHKLLWRYLTDKCDNAGCWDTNFSLASFQIGKEIKSSDLKVFGKMLKKLPDGKYYLVDFCYFQYGELSPKCKPHIPVINLLKKRGLYKDYLKGIHTLKEKEKDKEKDKEKEKEEKKPRAPGNVPSFQAITDYAGQLKKMRAQEKSNGTITARDYEGFYKKVSKDIGTNGLKEVKKLAKTI